MPVQECLANTGQDQYIFIVIAIAVIVAAFFLRHRIKRYGYLAVVMMSVGIGLSGMQPSAFAAECSPASGAVDPTTPVIPGVPVNLSGSFATPFVDGTTDAIVTILADDIANVDLASIDLDPSIPGVQQQLYIEAVYMTVQPNGTLRIRASNPYAGVLNYSFMMNGGSETYDATLSFALYGEVPTLSGERLTPNPNGNCGIYDNSGPHINYILAFEEISDPSVRFDYNTLDLDPSTPGIQVTYSARGTTSVFNTTTGLVTTTVTDEAAFIDENVEHNDIPMPLDPDEALSPDSMYGTVLLEYTVKDIFGRQAIGVGQLFMYVEGQKNC